MASILAMLASIVTPEMVSGLGKQFGLSDELTRRGLTITNATLAGGMARAGRSSEGKAALAEIISKADTSLLSNLSSVVTGTNSNSSAAVEAIFGRNLSLVTNGAKKATGIDITPILPICAPVVLAMVKNVMAQQQLDADGLAKLFESEVKSFNRRDPINAKVVKEIFRPLEAQDKLRATFSDEEWAKLKEAPAYAATLVILADRSGGTGRKAEIEALANAVAESAASAGPAELIGLLFAEGIEPKTIEATISAHRKTDEHELRQLLMAPVTEAIALVRAKASPGDATAYKGLLIDIAQKVASAAKEGGFMGMGGTLVSSQEKLAIDELAAMVGAD